MAGLVNIRGQSMRQRESVKRGYRLGTCLSFSEHGTGANGVQAGAVYSGSER